MSISNDRSLLEQQILSISGLQGTELENLKARLAALSEKQLQAELNKVLTNNKNWRSFDGVEITTSTKEEQAVTTGETVSHYKNEAGDEVTEKKQGETLLERVIKHTDENNKVIETVITYQEGKPVRKTKKENGETVSTTSYTKNSADNGVEYFTVNTENKDGSQDIINTAFIGQNGELYELGIIDKTTISNGEEVKTFRQKVNSGNNEIVMFVEQRKTSDGKTLIKMFDNMSYSNYQTGNTQERAQIAIINGKIYEVTYDEAGNTITHAMNNDNITKLSKNFNMTVDELLTLNPELKKGLKVNQNVTVSGRYDADSPQIIHQGTKSDAAKNYRNYVVVPQEKAKQQEEFEARINEKVIRATGTYQSLGRMPNSFGNRENISIKDFVQTTLKIDLNSELGKKVIERLSMMPDEELAKISYTDYEANTINHQHFNNFDEVSAALSIKSGLNIQTKDEYKLSHTISREKEEQNFYLDSLIGLVNITTNIYEQYYDNTTGTSFFMEKVRGLKGVDANELINKLKEMSNRLEQLKSLSPNALKKALKDEYGIKYSEFDARQLMRMSQNPDKTFEEYLKEIVGITPAELSKETPEKQNSIYNDYANYVNDKYIQNAQKILGVKLIDNANDDINSRAGWNMAGEMAIMFSTLGIMGEMNAIKGVKMATMAKAGKFGKSAFKPMAKLALGTMGKKAAVRTMNFGKGVGTLTGASLLGATDMGIYNLSSTTESNLAKLYDNRGEQINAIDSMFEGAEIGFAGGVIGGTLVRGSVALTDKGLQWLSKYAKAIPTASSKVTNAVGKLLQKSSVTTADKIMQTAMETQGPTKFAQAIGFGFEVAGFEVWNIVSTKLKGNIDPATGKLPPEWDEIFTTNYLWEHFQSEFKNIGQCKLIAKFAMFKFGSNSAQALMAKQTVDMSKSLKNIKVEPTRINGRELFFVTDETGKRYVLESTQQVLAFCNYSMRKDMITRTIGEEADANKGVNNGIAYTPAKSDGITFSDFEAQARNNGTNYEVITDENGNRMVRRVVQSVEVLGMGKTTYEVTIFDKEGNQIGETTEILGKELKDAHPSFFGKKASTKAVDNSHAGTLGMNTVVGGEGGQVKTSEQFKQILNNEKTFDEDANGNIVEIERFTESQRAELERMHEENPELIERLVNQKNPIEVEGKIYKFPTSLFEDIKQLFELSKNGGINTDVLNTCIDEGYNAYSINEIAKIINPQNKELINYLVKSKKIDETGAEVNKYDIFDIEDFAAIEGLSFENIKNIESKYPDADDSDIKSIAKLLSKNEILTNALLQDKRFNLIDIHSIVHPLPKENTNFVLKLMSQKIIDEKGNEVPRYTPKDIINSVSIKPNEIERFEHYADMKNSDGSYRFDFREAKNLTQTNHDISTTIDFSITDANGKQKYLLNADRIISLSMEISLSIGNSMYDYLKHDNLANVLRQQVKDNSISGILSEGYLNEHYSIIAKDKQGNPINIVFRVDKNNNPVYVSTETIIHRNGKDIIRKEFADHSRIVEEIDNETNNGSQVQLGYKKTYFDSEGKQVRSEVLAPSKKKGEFTLNSYDRTSDGGYKKTELGSVKTFGSKEQGSRVEKNLTAPDGTHTYQLKIAGPKGSSSKYVITDSDGVTELLSIERTHRQISDNHYESTLNGQKYDIKFEGETVTASKIDENGNITETVTLDSKQLDPQLMKLYKQLPGDYFFIIKEIGLVVNTDPSKVGNLSTYGGACYDSYTNVISISTKLQDDIFLFSHELGHAIDEKILNSMFTDKDYKNSVERDKENYSGVSTLAEGHSIDYFTKNGMFGGSNYYKEIIAESWGLMSGGTNLYTELYGNRNAVLQANMAPTIAKVGKAILDPVTYLRERQNRTANESEQLKQAAGKSNEILGANTKDNKSNVAQTVPDEGEAAKAIEGKETVDFSKARKLNANGEYENFALTTERDLLSSEGEVDTDGRVPSLDAPQDRAVRNAGTGQHGEGHVIEQRNISDLIEDVYNTQGINKQSIERSVKLNPDNVELAKFLLEQGYDSNEIEQVIMGVDKDFANVLKRFIIDKPQYHAHLDMYLPPLTTDFIEVLKELYKNDKDLVTKYAQLISPDSKSISSQFVDNFIHLIVYARENDSLALQQLVSMRNSNGKSRFTLDDCRDLSRDYLDKENFDDVINFGIKEGNSTKYILSAKAIKSFLENPREWELFNQKDVTDRLKDLPEGSVENLSMSQYFDNTFVVEANQGKNRIKYEFSIDRHNKSHYLSTETEINNPDGTIYRKNFVDGTKVVTKLKEGKLRNTPETRIYGYEKTFYDKNGNQTYSEVLTPTETNGEYKLNIYERGEGGYKKREAGTVAIDNNDILVNRNLVSADGITTVQEKAQINGADISTYEIKDKNGDIMYSHSVQRVKYDENNYFDTIDGNEYLVEYKEDCIVVNKIAEKTKCVISFDKLDKNLINLYKQMTADNLIRIWELDLTFKEGGFADKNNACFRSYTREEVAKMSVEDRKQKGIPDEGLPPGIDMSSDLKDDIFVALHELGHGIDYIFKIFADPRLQMIFSSELKDYKLRSSDAEGYAIDYFTNQIDPGNGKNISESNLIELVAEVNALVSGVFNPNGDILGARSIILQQNFPKTIAYIANALKNPHEYSKSRKEFQPQTQEEIESNNNKLRILANRLGETQQ